MTLSLRQRAILELAKTDGQVSVDDLASRFDVSPQTIRRDLHELCDARVLSRVHGGAVLESSVTNVVYETRRSMAQAEKAAIGRLCARDIADSASLFINIGTTTEAVAQALFDHRDMMVVTNNLNVARILGPSPGCEVIVAGGVLRPSDGGLVGEATADFVRQFKVDLAVIGTSAIDADGSLLDFDYREVQVTRAIIENARRKVLVADHTKFSRAAPVRITPIDALDALYTDAPPPAAIAQRCAEAGVEIRIAEVPELTS